MSILSYSHGLVDAANIDCEHPQLVPLPRRIADELTVLSVLGILAVADIGAVFETRVFFNRFFRFQRGHHIGASS